MQGWPEPKTAERLGDMIIRCFPRRFLRQKGKKETCEHLLTFIEKSFLDVHSMYCALSRSSRIPDFGCVLVSMDGFQIVGWILNSQGCNNIRILSLFETQQFSNVVSYRYSRPLLADDSVGMLSSASLGCRMSPWGYKNPRTRCRIS